MRRPGFINPRFTGVLKRKARAPGQSEQAFYTIYTPAKATLPTEPSDASAMVFAP